MAENEEREVQNVLDEVDELEDPSMDDLNIKTLSHTLVCHCTVSLVYLTHLVQSCVKSGILGVLKRE